MAEPRRLPQVVILAGGLGTRMKPLTETIPKLLLPVRGEPFAFHQLRLLAGQGAREVLYVIGFGGEQVRAAVGDGGRFGVAVTYVDEGDAPHGTGGALRFALDAGALSPVFLLLYGDSYLPIDVGAVCAAFARSSKPALLTVMRNEDRWDRSNTVYDGGRIVLYDKRSEQRDPRMAWIDYGLAVLTRDVVEEIERDAVIDLGELYGRLSRRGDLAGYEVASRFYEIGSPDGLAELERYLGTQGPG